MPRSCPAFRRSYSSSRNIPSQTLEKACVTIPKKLSKYPNDYKYRLASQQYMYIVIFARVIKFLTITIPTNRGCLCHPRSTVSDHKGFCACTLHMYHKRRCSVNSWGRAKIRKGEPEKQQERTSPPSTRAFFSPLSPTAERLERVNDVVTLPFGVETLIRA